MSVEEGTQKWKSEGDRFEFECEGYSCLLRRNPELGFWCGYVAVGQDHPDYKKEYHDLEDEIEVHGGLTYSDHCHGEICHKTENEDNVWWFGFDCGHGWDFVPYTSCLPNFAGTLHGLSESTNKTYRDKEYVTKEVRRLAEQLKAREVN